MAKTFKSVLKKPSTKPPVRASSSKQVAHTEASAASATSVMTVDEKIQMLRDSQDWLIVEPTVLSLVFCKINQVRYLLFLSVFKK